MIVDGHAHVASTLFTPIDFFKGVALNMLAAIKPFGVKQDYKRILDILIQQNQDHDADKLVHAMNEAGIDKTVLLLPDFTYALKSELSIAEMVERHAKIRERHPDRFFVFAGVDPRWGADALDLFERCITTYKFEGLKLYPPCGYSPSDESLFPFYEICQANKLPVLLHTGPTSPVLSFEESQPLLLDKAARLFQDVNFILAHGGVANVESTVQMCSFRPNVFCDISGFQSLGSNQHWKTHLHDLFSKEINHKIIFGTDWPVFSKKGNHSDIIKFFCSKDGPLAGLAAREQDQILYKNILGLIFNEE